jgi:hypothetical protein
VGSADDAAEADFATSLDNGDGRLGQFVQPVPEQTVLLNAEQKACPALYTEEQHIDQYSCDSNSIYESQEPTDHQHKLDKFSDLRSKVILTQP